MTGRAEIQNLRACFGRRRARACYPRPTRGTFVLSTVLHNSTDSESRSPRRVAGLAWRFAHAVSPRSHVRVAVADAAGIYDNSYPVLAPLSGAEPTGPFAVHLGCRNGREFGLIGFDLDAGRGDVALDLARLLELLDSAGIPYLVTASGPAGGRHVWVRPASPVPAGMVKQLARALRHQLPTLDISALSNPVAGALRPPGAAHRAGGRSDIILGDLEAFLETSATVDQVQALTAAVASALPPVSRDATLRIVAHDPQGHPHLPGRKRALPPRSQQALQTTNVRDASAVLWSVFLGAARAHWTFNDVAALVQTNAPGLEHLRTKPQSHAPGSVRVPRSASDAAAVLRTQWARAVAYVEATEASAPADDDGPDFIDRVAELVDRIEAAQVRANACPGRWSQAGGATDRLVFDQLCVLQLQAVTDSVEADQRRLALACGIGRETARRALDRLTTDAWILQEALAAGPQAARWAITQVPAEALSTGDEMSGAQADLRPADATLTLRAELLDRLQTTIGLQAHDVFTPAGLGHDAGAVWAQLTSGTQLLELQVHTGYPENRLDRYVDSLHELGLWHWDEDLGQVTTDSTARDTAARSLGIHSTLAERERRYWTERELWSWWQEHVDWLRTPGKAKRKLVNPRWRGRQSPAQLAIAIPGLTRTQRYGPYPRRGGRADHSSARTVVATAGVATAVVPASTVFTAA
jgi:hypothetical protein